MEQTFMKQKPVLPLVLSMSLPMVLSMMVSSLYNIVDSYFVARISEQAMTALSLVFPVQNLINAVTIGFAIGINAVISYYLGAGEPDRAGQAATQGMACNALHGLVLTVGCIACMPAFLACFTADTAVIDLGCGIPALPSALRWSSLWPCPLKRSIRRQAGWSSPWSACSAAVWPTLCWTPS